MKIKKTKRLTALVLAFVLVSGLIYNHMPDVKAVGAINYSNFKTYLVDSGAVDEASVQWDVDESEYVNAKITADGVASLNPVYAIYAFTYNPDVWEAYTAEDALSATGPSVDGEVQVLKEDAAYFRPVSGVLPADDSQIGADGKIGIAYQLTDAAFEEIKLYKTTDDGALSSEEYTEGSWTNTDVIMQIKVSPDISGAAVTVKNTATQESTLCAVDAATHTASYRIPAAEGQAVQNTCQIILEDRCGSQPVTVEKVIKTDRENPSVVNYVIDPDAGKVTTQPVTSFAYGFFYAKDTNINVVVSDQTGSGVKKVTYSLMTSETEYYSDNGVVYQEMSPAKFLDNVAGLTVPAGFKGRLVVTVIDEAGNQIQSYPAGFVIETKEQHESKAAIGTEVTAGAVITTTDNVSGVLPKLYGKNVELKLSAKDMISGIRKMSWRVVDESGKQIGTGEINTDSAEGFEGVREEGIYKEISKTIRVEGPDVKNAHVELTFTDNAGHTTAVSGEAFTIDASAPKTGTVKLTRPGYTGQNKKFYNGSDEVAFSYSVEDDNSGITEARLSLEKDGVSVGTMVTVTYDAVTALTDTSKTIRDFGLSSLEKGTYQIKCVVYNRTGYSTAYTPAEFYVDTSAPEYISYKVEKTSSTAEKILQILTFGIYSNDQVKVTVKAQDAESGIKSIEYCNKADETVVYKKASALENGSYSFVLSEEKLYQLCLRATDNVDNTGADRPLNSLQNDSGKSVADNEMILETQKPVITLTPQKPVYQTDTQYWYDSFEHVDVLVKVNDGTEPASGIASYRVGVNDTENVVGEEFNKNNEKILAYEKEFLGKDYADVRSEGKVTVHAQTEDNAGNKSDAASLEIYVDETAPVISRFEFLSESGIEKDGSVVEDPVYGYFFNKETNVRIHASDPQKNGVDGSGVKEIELQLVSAADNSVQSTEVKASEAGTDYAEFTIPAGFKGTIQARAKDNTGHQDGYVTPDQVVIETKEQHDANAQLQASIITETGYSTPEERYALYDGAVQVRLDAIDKTAGIKCVQYKVIADEKIIDSGEVTYDVDGNDETNQKEWEAESSLTDKNLIDRVAKTLTIDTCADHIRVEASFTDRAGNVSETVSDTFAIDKDIPEVTKLQASDPVYADADNNIYYPASDPVEFVFEADDITKSAIDSSGTTGSGIARAEITITKPDGTTGSKVISCQDRKMTMSEKLNVQEILGLNRLEQGEYSIEVKAVDHAGGQSTVRKIKFYVDTQKPVVTGYEVKSAAGVVDRILNVLTFGIYSNDKVEITVTAEDKNARVNTGLSNIRVVNLVTEKDIISRTYTHTDYQGTTVCQFTLDSFDDAGLYNLQITAADKVGNVSDSRKLSELPCTSHDGRMISNNEIILEKTAPVIDKLDTSGYSYMDGSSREWYASFENLMVNIEAGDYGKNISGLNNVRVIADGQELVWSAYYTAKTSSYKNDNQPLSRCYQYQNINRDGSVRMLVESTDNAGNKALSREKTVYVDENTPYVTRFEFYAADTAKEGSEAPVSSTDYGFFFQTATNVVVHTSDDGPTSGIDYVTFTLVDENGTTVKEERQYVDSNNCALFTVDAGFKGQVYARVIDHVGHESGNVHPNGVVAETLQQHEADAYVNISRQDTFMQAVNGLDLYNNDTDVLFSVKDHISGIDTIEWSVAADGVITQSGTVHISVDGSISGDGGWYESRKANLITEMSKAVRVTDNSAVITVRLRMIDRSGYEKNTETTFSIDKTAPAIAVTYDNNTPDASNIEYFKEARHATVVVTERNFDPSRININITNTDGVMPVISGWSETAGSLPNGDDITHTCMISYEADGDYVFDISMTDRAGYVNEAVNYANSAAPQKFTIDRTLPVMQISYDSSNLQNGNYSNVQRTATITVQEHNFNPADFVLTSRAADGVEPVAFPQMSAFRTDGDKHTADIRFENNAEYVYSIAYTDMAGNIAETLPEQDFFIDRKKPDVTVTNGSDTILDTAGNVDNRIGVFTKGTQVSPVVEVMDRNFNAASTSVSLVKRNGDAVEYSAADISNASGTGSRYSFRAIEDIYDNDGAYTLTYKAVDKAGNETTQVWDFKINRHGTQLNTAELKSLNNAVFNGSGMMINGKKNQKYILTLTCAQKLQSLRILLGNIELKDTQYRLSDPVELENGMYEYKLELLNDAFTRDGDYHLAIYTLVEGAQDEQELFSYWGEDLLITVDSSDPEQRVRDLKDEETYNMSEKAFDIVVDDPHLETLVVTLNGKSEEISVDDLEKTGESEYTLNYTVKARNSTEKQTLALEGKDIAGNTTKKFSIEGRNGEQTVEIASFMVTTSGWILFVESVKENIVLIIIIALIILLAVAGIVWMKVKKSSRTKTGGAE